MNEFSDEDIDSGKSLPVPKKQKKKATFSNILYLIFSQISFNKIFILKDIIGILCNPMPIKMKSKHMENLLHIMEHLKEKLKANSSGDTLDERFIMDLKNSLDITDSSTTRITSTLLSELAEVWQSSLNNFIQSARVSSSTMPTTSLISTSYTCAPTRMDVVDAGEPHRLTKILHHQAHNLEQAN